MVRCGTIALLVRPFLLLLLLLLLVYQHWGTQKYGGWLADCRSVFPAHPPTTFLLLSDRLPLLLCCCCYYIFTHYARCVPLSRVLASFPPLAFLVVFLPTSTTSWGKLGMKKVSPAPRRGCQGQRMALIRVFHWCNPTTHTQNLANTFRWHSGKTFNHCTSSPLCLHLAELNLLDCCFDTFFFSCSSHYFTLISSLSQHAQRFTL